MINFPRMEYSKTIEERYGDGGTLHIEIWMHEGKPHRRYKLPWGERYKPKEGSEGDVAFKVLSRRERPLQEVWEEVLRMMEPA